MPRRRPRLEQSGLSTTIENGVPTTTPIYSIAFGEVARAEAEASYWHARFGPHGLDATIWAPDPDRSGTWIAVDYRRPVTALEAIRFGDRPDAFATRRTGSAEILPDPLARLTGSQRSRIEYVVRYRAGGMRVGLLVGTSAHEAEDILRALELRALEAGGGLLTAEP